MKVPGFTFCGSLSQSFNHFRSLFFATWVRSGNLTLPDAGSTILWQALQPYSFTSILPASFLGTFPRKSFFTSLLKVLKNSIRSEISCSDLHGTLGITVSFKTEGGSLSQFLSHSSVLLKVNCVRSGPMTPPTHSMLWQAEQPLSLYIFSPLLASPEDWPDGCVDGCAFSAAFEQATRNTRNIILKTVMVFGFSRPLLRIL